MSPRLAASSYGSRPAPTAVLVRLSTVSVVLLVAGLGLGRPDVVALAAPFTVALFLAVRRARSARVEAELEISRAEVVEGTALDGTLTIRTTGDLDAVVVDVQVGIGLALRDGVRRRAIAVRGGEEVVVNLGIVAARWGHTAVGPVHVNIVTAGLAFAVAVPDRPTHWLTVLPSVERFRSDASLPYAVTAAGSHRSLVRGDGVDFAGIRPFVFGDRLRRVNWRVSQRTGSLQVVDSFTERASEVVVLIDSAQDVGVSGGVGGTASSLDAAVRAAATVTAHHLRRGDAVRLVDVGTRLRFLRRLTGRRDFVVACNWLLDTRLAEVGEAWVPDRVAALAPPRATVLALTPLLDERMTTLVARLRQRGQPVVVVDTLPPDAVPRQLDVYEALARRMWMMERERTVALLVESGCPVVPWTTTGALDRALRELSVAALAPRAAAR
ncbi:MAG: DUF58 domain-containing protein [Actinomycetota bacterium]|nr:DUF58 domain-containing protein [Actinomycetota bacterium]